MALWILWVFLELFKEQEVLAVNRAFILPECGGIQREWMDGYLF